MKRFTLVFLVAFAFITITVPSTFASVRVKRQYYGMYGMYGYPYGMGYYSPYTFPSPYGYSGLGGYGGYGLGYGMGYGMGYGLYG
ncbi:hypothetical protein RB195_003219 [Necator americanus]|uniref:Uncharacterized protein n=1 Tax=Necator americanus TaxID=51031 RepID=A0ABR1DMJ7_NECAM